MNKETKIGVITLIVIIALIGIALVAIKSYNNKHLEDAIETTWGQEYYKYLTKNLMDQDTKDKIKTYTVDFYKIEDLDNPIMVVEYEYEGDSYSNIYYIKGDEIKFINSEDPTTVDLLYNKETKKQEYYTIVTNKQGDYYEDIKTQIHNADLDPEDKNRIPSTGHLFSEKIPEFPKFDEVFKRVKVDREDIKLTRKSSDKDIQQAVIKKIKEYKKTNNA